MPPPGYLAVRPRYPALRALNTVSGLQDTLVNLGELALRRFEEALVGQDAKSFVVAEARRLRVNTRLSVGWDAVRANVHLYALIQSMAVLEAFAKDLGDEMHAYKEPAKWITSNNKGGKPDALTILTLNMSDAARRIAVACPEFSLLAYYRLVRNAAIHRAKIDLAAARADVLAKHESHFVRCYQQVPGEVSGIGYGDFLLATRAIKYYAMVLNDCCELTPADVVRFHLSSGDFRADLRDRKGQPKKIQTLVKRLVYDYVMPAGDEDVVMEALSEWLDRDPTKRQRRRQRTRK